MHHPLTNIELATEEDHRYNVDKWARFFKCNTWEDIRMFAKENVTILEAAETVYEISEDERIRQQMEAREDYYRRQRSRESRYKRRFAKLEKDIADRDTTIADLTAEIADKDTAIADQAADRKSVV